MALEDWNVQTVRLTAFPDLDQEVVEPRWWEELIGQTPENRISRPRQEGLQEDGPYSGGTLLLRLQRYRIDWLLTVTSKEDDDDEQPIPSLGQLSELLPGFERLMARWLEVAPNLQRLAFGAVVVQPVEDRASGYTVFRVTSARRVRQVCVPLIANTGIISEEDDVLVCSTSLSPAGPRSGRLRFPYEPRFRFVSISEDHSTLPQCSEGKGSVFTDTDAATTPQSEEMGKAISQKEQLEAKVRDFFFAAREEHFEDGMESEFSLALTELVARHGVEVLELIRMAIARERVNAEVASEAMRWLGRMEDPDTYKARLHLLEHGLSNASARVRDGASLGLASMDDPHAIGHLRKAIDRETCPELREDLQQVLDQLEDTQRCQVS